MKNVDLSIVIVSFNTLGYLKQCLATVYSGIKEVNCEIIVVDNGSSDGSSEYLKKEKKAKRIQAILNQDNLGFAKANNQGIKIAKGRYILLLNSDTKLDDISFKEIITWMENHPKAGLATCRLVNEDLTTQGTGGYFPNLPRVFSWMFFIDDIPFLDKIIHPFHPHHPRSPFYKGDKFFVTEREQDWITGAFFLIRRQVINQIGLIDERYFMYVEDLDYCFRAKKAGWKLFYLPQWSIIHFGGKSSTKEFPLISEMRAIKMFYRKHYPSWQYPILVFLLKCGALVRIPIFGILEGKHMAQIYAKAFLQI